MSLFRRPPCTAYVRIRWFASSDRPLDRPTKMAGETFSCWSTQVNKDALFVTAILLLSIARLSERLVQRIPKRRTRPNFSPPSSFVSVFRDSFYILSIHSSSPLPFLANILRIRIREEKEDKNKKRSLQ